MRLSIGDIDCFRIILNYLKRDENLRVSHNAKLRFDFITDFLKIFLLQLHAD